MHAMVRRLSTAATIGMFLVLVMGATVTNTGSAEGCGRSWPLCHGQFVPEFAVATLIEYTHRAISGIEGLLVAALAAGAWTFWRRHREVQVLALATLGLTVLQAGLGAWAVLEPQAPAVLALHFGISLLAFGGVFLTAALMHEADGGEGLRERAVAPGYRWAVWGATLYVLLIVYLGAYVRHTDVVLACADWPLCNGVVFPGFAGPPGVNFLHRLAALGGVLALGGLALWSRRLRTARPDLSRASVAAFALIVVQALSGGAVVLTALSLFSALAHAAIMALLFASLAYLCLHVLPRLAVPAEERALPLTSPASQGSMGEG